MTSQVFELFPEMAQFERRLQAIVLDPEKPWFHEPIEYLLGLEGKRIRPLLTLASQRLFRSDPEALALDAGVLIEILHTASLLHDDVIDEAKVRRSRPTLNFRWGDKVAVLVGDYLLARLFYRIYELNDFFILQEFVQNSRLLSEGSLLELRQQYNPRVTPEEYYAIIGRKTGSLFSLSCTLGSYLGGAPERDVQTMKAIGQHLGLGFQIVDDVLDYAGESKVTGKELLKDLKEGYFTLPFILAFDNGPARKRISKLAGVPPTEWKGRISGELPFIREQIRTSGSLERAREIAEGQLAGARTMLQTLPETEWRDRFESFMDRLVERIR